MIWGKQVLRHVWTATRAGKRPLPLGLAVVEGAANVASLRRLRNLVHGVVALNTISAQTGASHHGRPASKHEGSRHHRKAYAKRKLAGTAAMQRHASQDLSRLQTVALQ